MPLTEKCVCRDSRVIGLFTVSAQRGGLALRTNSALELVHALLGVSHSPRALEIAPSSSTGGRQTHPWLTSRFEEARRAYAGSSKQTVEDLFSPVAQSGPVRLSAEPKLTANHCYSEREHHVEWKLS